MTKETLIVGLSGVSSSGKTTLARLLREVWPGSSILHEDDMYFTDQQIPVKNGFQDWDCLEAIDLSKFRDTLACIRKHCSLPPDLDSKEDRNLVGESGVDRKVVHQWKDKAMGLTHPDKLSIVIVDGFLLYSQAMESIWSEFDLKLFLWAKYHTVKSRREARSGYVTLEGFWQDPPGYVDDIVWPNYVKEHAFLFEHSNADGPLDQQTCQSLQIEPMPQNADGDMTACLDWACQALQNKVQKK